ncbi:MAG: 5-oxoprolinase subunit PxpB [Bryobacteraceae bacterium]
MQIRPASDHSLLVVLGEGISREIHLRVLRLVQLLAGSPPPGLVDLHPAYASVLVRFNPIVTSRDALEREVRERVADLDEAPAPEPRIVEIPVRYGGAEGPDLEDVARLSELSMEEVVRLHSEGDYLVYFLGFSPGFPYLGGMSPRLAVPRLEVPRSETPAGSVAIGGSQTGVYPLKSPGGWRIVGRTPLSLFSLERDPPVLLRMGDRVRFVPLP